MLDSAEQFERKHGTGLRCRQPNRRLTIERTIWCIEPASRSIAVTQDGRRPLEQPLKPHDAIGLVDREPQTHLSPRVGPVGESCNVKYLGERGTSVTCDPLKCVDR